MDKVHLHNWHVLTYQRVNMREADLAEKRSDASHWENVKKPGGVQDQLGVSRNPVQDVRYWYDATLDADHWAALSDIEPNVAAMLLCRHNPEESNWDSLSSDETGTTSYEESKASGKVPATYTPKHLRMLARRLTDIDKADHKPRTLRDWHQTARSEGLAYHSWIDGYMEATPPPVPRVAETKQHTKARRYQMCIDAGLQMPDNDYAELPTGIGELAKKEGISTQAFSKSVKLHIAGKKR